MEEYIVGNYLSHSYLDLIPVLLSFRKHYAISNYQSTKEEASGVGIGE